MCSECGEFWRFIGCYEAPKSEVSEDENNG
jgi:hypothetical protein